MKVKRSKYGDIESVEFGKVLIHRHVNHPGKWVITCRPVNVYAENLCDNDGQTPEELKEEAISFFQVSIIRRKYYRDFLENS